LSAANRRGGWRILIGHHAWAPPENLAPSEYFAITGRHIFKPASLAQIVRQSPPDGFLDRLEFDRVHRVAGRSWRRGYRVGDRGELPIFPESSVAIQFRNTTPEELMAEVLAEIMLEP